MCRLVIIDCGMKLRRVWDGHVKRTECLGSSIIVTIITITSFFVSECHTFRLSELAVVILKN